MTASCGGEVSVGLLDRLFGPRQRQQQLSARELAAEEVQEIAHREHEEIVEIVEVVGESYHQEALGAIAGPKDLEGKRTLTGVVLRCEPTNEYDANAVRVEVMGNLVAHVSRSTAATLSPAMLNTCGGVLEARGLIVGGWRDEGRDGHGRFTGTASEGSYGIRVWITSGDAQRLGIRPDTLDPSLRPHWPDLPDVGRNEHRLSPSRDDIASGRLGTSVTVTCEEHYQDAIAATMPDRWDPERTWPLLMSLALTTQNPHQQQTGACIEVRANERTIGYLTRAMSERYSPILEECARAGTNATAYGRASRGAKGGTLIWRVKLQLLTS
jgi:hypothetical protein